MTYVGVYGGRGWWLRSRVNVHGIVSLVRDLLACVSASRGSILNSGGSDVRFSGDAVALRRLVIRALSVGRRKMVGISPSSLPGITFPFLGLDIARLHICI